MQYCGHDKIVPLIFEINAVRKSAENRAADISGHNGEA